METKFASMYPFCRRVADVVLALQIPIDGPVRSRNP